jgi:hypothetical protein
MYKETWIISNARLSTNHEKMSFSGGNLRHMHTRAHHTEQMDAWHESFFFTLLLSWHHILMHNEKCCIQSRSVCNTTYVLTWWMTSPCRVSVPSIQCVHILNISNPTGMYNSLWSTFLTVCWVVMLIELASLYQCWTQWQGEISCMDSNPCHPDYRLILVHQVLFSFVVYYCRLITND